MNVGSSLRAALSVLYDAQVCAMDAEVAPWTFAVEVSELRELGIDNVWLRWLIVRGFVLHAREVASGEASERRFEREGHLQLTRTSCFILTPDGATFAKAVAEERLAVPLLDVGPHPAHRTNGTTCSSVANGHTTIGPELSCPHPSWCAERKELSFIGRVIKTYVRPAPNQEAILMAFEEEGWPFHVDDPIVPKNGCNPRQRLRASVQGMNRQSDPPAIEFSCDGSGMGVCWRPIGSSRCDGKLFSIGTDAR